jgi:hypothetical protein
MPTASKCNESSFTRQAPWPTDRVSAAEVRAWVGRECGGVCVNGPVEVYSADACSVTALFHLESSSARDSRDVVCKVLFSRLARSAPNVYSLLNRYCTGRAPLMLAWQRTTVATWVLFERFASVVHYSLWGRASAKSLGEALAEVQSTIARLHSSELEGIPTLPVGELPKMLYEITQDAITYGIPAEGSFNPRLPAWAGVTETQLRAISDFSPLNRLSQKVEQWVKKLNGLGFPMSLHHPDLAAANAVETPSGSLLLFDWDEACLSSPVFSLGVMSMAGEPPRGAHGNDVTASEVCEAYLTNLPWGEAMSRRRAYDLAVKLAPIVDFHRIATHLKELGRYMDVSVYTAAWMLRHADRWKSV